MQNDALQQNKNTVFEIERYILIFYSPVGLVFENLEILGKPIVPMRDSRNSVLDK